MTDVGEKQANIHSKKTWIDKFAPTVMVSKKIKVDDTTIVTIFLPRDDKSRLNMVNLRGPCKNASHGEVIVIDNILNSRSCLANVLHTGVPKQTAEIEEMFIPAPTPKLGCHIDDEYGEIEVDGDEPHHGLFYNPPTPGRE